jgi:exonuclease III
VPEEWFKEIAPDALRRQFARTPYAVSFRSATETFILVTLHITYGSEAAERAPELRGISRWMREWADRINAWSQNLIALGDFNIDRQDDPLWQAFTSTTCASGDCSPRRSPADVRPYLRGSLISFGTSRRPTTSRPFD